MTPSRRSPWPALTLALALLAAMATALGVGPYAIALPDLLRLLAGEAPALAGDPAGAVLWQVRAPRVAAAALVGAALALSGTGMQAVFRNALASPDLLGVSAGAAFGAVFGLVLGWPLAMVQGAAFAGGLGAVGLVWLAARLMRVGERVLSLILCGIAIGSLLTAGVAMLQVIADPFVELPAITFWLLGSFASVTGVDVALLAVTTALAAVVLVVLRWRVDLLLLSDDEVRTSGVHAARLRAAVIVACTVATSGAVAVAGIVGWIGLVIPHVARLLVGAGFARALPVAMLAGGLVLVVADTVGRTLTAVEIPPGVVMAILGAPSLLALLALRAAR